MPKEQIESSSQSELIEDLQRQESHSRIESEFPEALRVVLLMLLRGAAKMKIQKENSGEKAIVIDKTSHEDIFMTMEPSEIAMLKDPVAGLKLLGEINPLDFNSEK